MQTKTKFIILLIALLSACYKPVVNYYDHKDLVGQTIPSDMVFVPGQGKIPSFYIGVSEEPNINYVAYLHWLQRVYVDLPEVYQEAQIKFNKGTEVNQFNDPSLVYHMEHPAFAYYPIVGATWHQIQSYLQWKSDRLNESILIQCGILGTDIHQANEENFNLEAYLVGQYQGVTGKRIQEGRSSQREARWQDGILIGGYRLPTEAEWALLEQENEINTYHSNYPYGKNYPFLRWLREPYSILVNDYMYEGKSLSKYDVHWRNQVIPNPADYPNYSKGIQGPQLNSNSHLPSNIKGNVHEWLLDFYKDTIQTEWNNLAEYLDQNGFYTNEMALLATLDEYGVYDMKDSLGRMEFRVLGTNTDGSPMKAVPSFYQRYYIHHDIRYRRVYWDKKEHYITNSPDTFYRIYKDGLIQLYIHENISRTRVYPQPFSFTDITSILRSGKSNYNFNYAIPQPLNRDSLNNEVRHWVNDKWTSYFKDSTGHLSLVTLMPLSQDSIGLYSTKMVVRGYRPVDSTRNDHRLIRGGTWIHPDFNYREGLHPDSSRTDIGFRTVLPYPNMPVEKKYKANWK